MLKRYFYSHIKSRDMYRYYCDIEHNLSVFQQNHVITLVPGIVVYIENIEDYGENIFICMSLGEEVIHISTENRKWEDFHYDFRPHRIKCIEYYKNKTLESSYIKFRVLAG